MYTLRQGRGMSIAGKGLTHGIRDEGQSLRKAHRRTDRSCSVEALMLAVQLL